LPLRARARAKHRAPFSLCRADIQRRAGELFNAEVVESYTSANDVHDRVHGAHFVKVNLFERHVVDKSFSFAELRENGRGALTYLRRESRFSEGFRGLRRAIDAWIDLQSSP